MTEPYYVVQDVHYPYIASLSQWLSELEVRVQARQPDNS